MLNKTLLVATLLCASALVNTSWVQAKDLQLNKITLPAGFKIEVFADVPEARSMTFSPNGTLFVGTRADPGNVYAVLDDNKDGKADRVITIAKGLKMPNGVAFRNGSLYVGEISRIIRFDDIEKHLNDPPKPVVVYDKLPTDTHHGWKFIKFGPDDKLYVPVGAPCNVCERPLPYESIMRMNADGSGFEYFSRGVRNTVGFDWDSHKNLWFTDNGRDWLGDKLPPDELNYAPKIGMDFGFPYRYGNNVSDPEYGAKKSGDFTPPVQDLGAHVAALGMRFYNGKMFPAKYRNQIFIAQHGSWNSSVKVGYRVMLVEQEGGVAKKYTTFADGWLVNDKVWGRPVDVQVAPDGALLISDDMSGTIYRVSYNVK